MMHDCCWKYVPCQEATYLVSNKGEIKSIKTGKTKNKDKKSS